ncbi:hypothetical protein HMPREF1092_01791 [Clostridium thermobutyricum]|uniref:TIR domain-containing protein n=1 Tax=Clostridium thermobutyricum TaxID=29372 RepID=N9WHK2_9CLOT|nr:toll/interleukin-1 receptor domain-containing protein [Clostridium thermobutyricum]ENZ02556.1 hypothetical protein HMPREF1092_01791 [Clostridium thermobutyricum]
MSGYTKHMYEMDIHQIKVEFSKYIKTLLSILPKDYDINTIISLLIEYYPYEWQILNEKYEYYCKKDKKLKSVGQKIRYSMREPIKIIQNLKITTKIMSESYRNSYKLQYDEYIQLKNIEIFQNKRLPKIKHIKDKIDKAKLKTQQVEPFYLDALIGLYDKKKTSQKDRVYIMLELKKYYCPKVISFFKKKANSEYNIQLREMAFYHLQEFKHYVILRKQKYMRIPSKNKRRRKYLKEVYAKQKYNIKKIPEELEYRIKNSKEQKLKEYDFFISHSSLDHKAIQILIKELNKNSKNIYCDWINDTDYLKRNLVGDATKAIIEKRLEQSKNLLFVRSENSEQSNWVKYELNYFNSLNKRIYVIDKANILNGNFSYYLIHEKWFLDENYKNICLFKI